jgi:hypothetical protein
MNDHPFKFRRPTEIEDKAFTDATRHFAEHVKQFPTSHRAVKHLETHIATTAVAAYMSAQQSPHGNPILADSGSAWHKSVDVSENISVCHRNATGTLEFAVVEHFPANGRNEVLVGGRNAVEVLKAFTHDQHQALQIWKEDWAAQVKEFLAGKYPGQEMDRVVDAFIIQHTQASFSQRQALTQSHQHKHGRGIGI